LIIDTATQTLAKLGCHAENSLYALSVCPDEINHEHGDIADLVTKHSGEIFHLGGLGGLPFTGKTGFGAFSSHVPDDGHLVIIFAPHVGVSKERKLGFYSRNGQSGCGSACGAACGALKFVESGQIVDPASDFLPDDYQMNYIKKEVASRFDIITQGKESECEKQAELCVQMYEISKLLIEKIVSTTFGGKNSKLIILGGIMINMPGYMEDFFQPRMFEVRPCDGSPSVDLMECYKGFSDHPVYEPPCVHDGGN
jgi:hypothetical protein